MSNPSKEKKKDETTTPSVSNKGGMDVADAGNMDKIRDILFGNQARDYEKRFSKMESWVSRETAELKQELIKRLDSLEGYVKQEIRDINERITNESKDRGDAEKLIHREMESSVDKLTKKIAIEEENLAKKSTELREKILEQSKTLADDIAAKNEQAASALQKTARELDDAKVNRSDLSGFLLDIAMRLSGDDNGSSAGN